MNMKINNQGFTLIELLVVLALIAILAVVIIVVIKPTEIFKKSRDTQRIANLKQIDQALTAIQAIDPTFNELNYFSPNTVYLSLKMNTATSNCLVDYPDLPALPSGWSYRCSQAPTNIDGSGWLPLNFNNFPIVNLAQLPIDPINKPPHYYSFVAGGSYKLTAKPEINYGPAINDNGFDPLLYEVGTDLKLSTFQSGLVGYWSFDEGSGTIAYDKSGYGNNGTLYSSTTICSNPPTSGCPQWTTGKVGGALSFDGVDDYVEVSPSSSLGSFSTSLTVSAWYYTSDSVSTWRAIVAQQHVSGQGYILYIRNGRNNYKPAFSTINGDCPTCYESFATTGVQLNTWEFLVGVYDNGFMKIYKNGKLEGQISASSFFKNASHPLKIGTNDYPHGWYDLFSGLIDEVRIYNRALSDQEIKALYEATK